MLWCKLRHDRSSGWFSKSWGLSASVSFLSSPPTSRSFTCTIFCAVLDSRSLSLLLTAQKRMQAKHGHVTTTFMSHYQELLVSFFQSKETHETDIFFFLEDMIKGLLITCHSVQCSLIIFLTVPTQTTYKINFSFDVNDGKTTNMKISSPVPVE